MPWYGSGTAGATTLAVSLMLVYSSLCLCMLATIAEHTVPNACGAAVALWLIPRSLAACATLVVSCDPVYLRLAAQAL